jgi:hypothetical protein
MYGSKFLDVDTLVPHAPSTLRVVLGAGLLGGKGGFGAMLRSQGKGAGQKATTDFGSCRDLSGRRLRHVNQEIAMEKWQAEEELRAQRKRDGVDEREIAIEPTASGIQGWYLSTPSWAEGFGKKAARRAKSKRNTIMCTNWLQARARATPPPNAPRYWGCPRGRNCNYAHGEEELRGEELTLYKKKKKEEAMRAKDEAFEAYLHPRTTAASANTKEDDMEDAFRAGLAKRSVLLAAQAAQKEILAQQMVYEAPGISANGNGHNSTVMMMRRPASIGGSWLVPLNGHIHVTQTTMKEHARVQGIGTFGTATVFGVALHQGKWYYEVTLETSGVMQLGWADAALFEADDDEGDGVGDHAASWAYDGCRQVKWSNGISAPYGQVWLADDIIGCLCDIDTGTIAFSRNGILMGVAYDTICASALSDITTGGLFPAVSLEADEAMRVNIGDFPFQYKPPEYCSVLDAIQNARQTLLEDLSNVLPIGMSQHLSSKKQIDPHTTNHRLQSHAQLPHGIERESLLRLSNVTSPRQNNDMVSIPPRMPLDSDIKPSTMTARIEHKPARAATREPVLDLMAFPSLEAVKALGLNGLKDALIARGLKCGYDVINTTLVVECTVDP